MLNSATSLITAQRTGHAMCMGRASIVLAAALLLAGCSSLGTSGPRASRVASASNAEVDSSRIALVDLTDDVARHVIRAQLGDTFHNAFGDASAREQAIGPGDVIDISIWEAPPATLFGSAMAGSAALATGSAVMPATSQNAAVPSQMVTQSGTITIPFVGTVLAAGRTGRQLEQEIVSRLASKAHLPQVMVRISSNRSSNVTVVGDVANSTMTPLTAKGERLLDALAAAGGVKQPTSKMTLRLTRGNKTVTQPLEAVLLDPMQNIRLQSGDVITALFQPYTFVSLGAVGGNAEIPFEATGLTLAQALARAGGLQDNRADTRGVFIFRLEQPEALPEAVVRGRELTPDGRIPVIYRVNLSDPRSFFIAQGFPIRNKDVLYVSNAPLADLQKFVSIVSSMAFSIIGVTQAVQ